MDEDRTGDKLEVNPPNSSDPPRFEREKVRPRRDVPPPRPQERAARQETRQPLPASASGTNKPLILAILYLSSVIFGLSGLVAFILAIIWKAEPNAPWEASHYEYQIRTFLIWFCTTIFAFALIVTLIGALIGIPLLVLAVIWVFVRGLVSLIRAANREPMPNPQTLLA
jgi:uncharacterized membrane protein